CGRSAKEINQGEASSSGTKGKKEKIYGENHEDYFPDELNVWVGKRVLWRFHYTNDHIINNNHVYQVKLLSEDEDYITLFKKDFIAEDSVDDMNTSLMSNATSRKLKNVDNIPFSLVKSPLNADGSFKGKDMLDNATEEDGGDYGSGKQTIIDLDDYDEEAAIAKRRKKAIHVKLEPTDSSTRILALSYFLMSNFKFLCNCCFSERMF
nr:replication protein A 70 kDa DNA-binding subunit B [Tanacetum cinerariifolium]